jgi:orotidine-5'-phosphate decarboxylase
LFVTKEKIIVALDVPTAGEAHEVVAELRGTVGAFKIGLQLFTAEGPTLVKDLARRGSKIFLDAKYHDIPNTVAQASVEAAKMGIWMVNVHASGGSEMMVRAAAAAREFADRENLKAPLIIAVTVLTSHTEKSLAETGVNIAPLPQVLNLSRLTAKCGLDGVVCSGEEILSIRESVSRDFLIVVPGIRSRDEQIASGSETSDDQKRLTTAGTAIGRGADYIVVGRPVLNSGDRKMAVADLVKSIESFVAD